MERILKTTTPVRERGKARRYAEIVSAAAGLWREHGIENVSLNQIAATAEVAPQTVYNLIGGLDAIGFAVVILVLDELDATMSKSPASGTELALETVRTAVKLLTNDSKLYRQVLVRIPKVLFDGTHLGRDLAEGQISAVRDAQTNNEISNEIDPVQLGKAMYTCYLGALYDWACGDSDDADFLRSAEIAILAPLAACGTNASRPALTASLFARLSG
ncbi:TetR/AcrR family transcriptional regulator [Pseudomonas sp. PS02288]|uniref:TetR/AcrR family transcriptional regulator n=1 Tax=Pseudomonas sp. PS02288 TaxID=2991443 RepID=UPI002499E11F|nr:TetR/AcrR family transcriptional regulator [Pseudomonas sp. PS02288]